MSNIEKEYIKDNGSDHIAPVAVKKVGKRQFHAGVKFQGQWITATGKQTKTAVKALEQALVERNIPLVNWKVQILEPVELSLPKTESAEKADTSPATERSPSVCQTQEEVPNLVSPRMELPKMPTLDTGLVTPISDKTTWVAAYRKAVGIIVSTESQDLNESYGERIRRFQSEVIAIMENPKEGHPCVGAWRRMPSGDSWLSLTDEPDPTVRKVQRGEGSRRERNWKNINGNRVDVSGKSENGSGRSKSRSKSSSGYNYPGSPEQTRLAYKAGRAASSKAAQNGHPKEVQNIWYKLAYVVSLRSQEAPPHTKFELDLTEAGITTEQVERYVSQAKAS